MRRFVENPEDAAALQVLNQNPNVSNKMRTTCVATMLSAGHAENALPQSATATVNCRIFPGVTAGEVRQTLIEVSQNNSIEIEILGDPLESPVSALNENVTAAVSNAVHAMYPDLPIIPEMAAYGTDGKEMRHAGMPTYGVMGLFIREEEVFAHGLNERVPVRSFYAALDYWHQILSELAGS